MKSERMMQILIPVAVFLLFSGGSARNATLEPPQTDSLVAIADELLPIAARLRGLEPKAPIQKGIKSREEISAFIHQQVDRHFKKGELVNEGLMLKKLGLIPMDMDYADFSIKLLTEQIGGYYDPEKKSLVIAGWLPVQEQKPALIHELTHALQDQHFKLGDMMKRSRALNNDDMSLAHQAIHEGDAMAVTINYMLEPAGKTFLDMPNFLLFMNAQMAVMSQEFKMLKSAPEYIREILVFPYTYGTAFLQRVMAANKSWAAVNRIYDDLPSSTEQIIHPEKYLEKRDPPKMIGAADPARKLGKDWEIARRNVLGEFSFFLLLKLHLPEEAARKAATGWGGDQAILASNKKSGLSALFVESEWDDLESASRISEALSAWLKQRYPTADSIQESGGGLALLSAGEFHSVRRTGASVRLILGVPESLSGGFR